METDRILNCDCVVGMRELPPDIIDLILTSPPYDQVRTYDPLPLPKFKEVADEMFRITKPGGVVVWVVQEQIANKSQTGTSSDQRVYFRDIGFRLWDRLIMDRYGRRTPIAKRYGLPLEEAFVLTKGDPVVVGLHRDRRRKMTGAIRFKNRCPDGSLETVERYLDDRPGIRPNIWRYAVGRHSAKEAWIRRMKHGALMPEKMAEDLILSYSKPGDLVLDPFSGLATTCKLALLNHRRYLGMEINKIYFEMGLRRMEMAQLQYMTTLLGMLGA